MTEQTESSQSLGNTAFWTAAARAQESQREDRLFNDPWATALAGPKGAEWLAGRGGNVSSMVIRTHYFDSFLHRVVSEAGIRQVVILAAGLDTRAYRMEWSAQTRLFELDQPAVLRYKAEVLDSAGAQPTCERQPIPADLTTDWKAALLGCGFNPALPSAWLLEGILFYLPKEAITHVLDEVTTLAAPDSWLGFDIINSVTLTSPITHAWIEMQANLGAPWIGSLDDPEGFLSECGWQAALTQPGLPDANFNRWTLPVIPLKAPTLPHNWYVTAQKLNV